VAGVLLTQQSSIKNSGVSAFERIETNHNAVFQGSSYVRSTVQSVAFKINLATGPPPVC
jgi:hypothetical protein